MRESFIHVVLDYDKVLFFWVENLLGMQGLNLWIFNDILLGSLFTIWCMSYIGYLYYKFSHGKCKVWVSLKHYCGYNYKIYGE